MGKGDKRSGKGKIFKRSHGKTRPSPKALRARAKKAAAAKKAAKK